MKNKNIQGMLMVFSCALFWALSGNVGSFLFKEKLFTPSLLVALRLLGSGIVLLSLNLKRLGKSSFKIFSERSSIISLLVYSLAGLMLMQYSYFTAIDYSNPPTATIIQYLGAFIIIFYAALVLKQKLSYKVYLSLVLAMTGVFFLITHGDPSTLEVSELALFYAVLSMIGYAIYNLAPLKISLKYDTISIVSFAMFIAGIVLVIITRPFTGDYIIDWQSVLGALYCISFGTFIPFALFIEAQKLIGPSRASIYGLVEPLFSTIISVIWLGTNFIFMDYLGVLLILLAIFLLSLPSRDTTIVIPKD